ncbi:serine hydrolase FSH [Aspergillus unguis]
MKILCLHGRGSSGAIFQAQTSSIRIRLEATHPTLTFDFIDGPHACSPAPGIELFYGPPYYSFYAEPKSTCEGGCVNENGTDAVSLESIKQAHAWLKGIIAERGPYDLVMAFSQGTALAAGILLEHEYQKQQQQQQQSLDMSTVPDPPFKSAIFICGGAPLSFLEDIGYTIPRVTKERDRLSRKELAWAASSERILAAGPERWTTAMPYTSAPPLSYQPLQFQTTFDLNEIRAEISGPVKISVPTVHIYGERDPRYIAGLQLAEVCEHKGGKRKVYNHGGGHEIPRFEAVSGAVADLVRWGVSAALIDEEA